MNRQNRIATTQASTLPRAAYLIACVLIAFLGAALIAALHPSCAYAATGDPIYAYLDRDENNEYNVLTLTSAKRPEALLGFRDLGQVTSYNKPNSLNFVKTDVRTVRIEGAISPSDLNNWFQDCTALISVDLTGLDSSNVTSMKELFSGCTSLSSVNFSGLDTSHVTDMSCMFSGCSSLASLDLSMLDTSNVANMLGMFGGCLSLGSIAFKAPQSGSTGFRASNVTDMRTMFSGCSSLTELDLSGFGLMEKSPIRMESMFQGCSSLVSLNLTGFGTSQECNVVMRSAFANCSSLTSLDLSAFNTSSNSNLQGAFDYCENLGSLTIGPGFKCSGAGIIQLPAGSNIVWKPEGSDTEMDRATLQDLIDYVQSVGSPVVFSPSFKPVSGNSGTCAWSIDSEGKLTISSGTLGELSSGKQPWANYASRIHSVEFEGSVTASGNSCSHLFDGCNHLVSVDLSNLETSAATDLSNMFYGCTSLTSLDVSGLDTSRVTKMPFMFDACSSLTQLKLVSDIPESTKFDTSSVEDMGYMFYECPSLAELDLSQFDTSSARRMSMMFASCRLLTSLDLSSFDTSNAKLMDGMFFDCSSLVDLDLSSFTTDNATDISGMFSWCSSLTSLDLSGFRTSSVTDMSGMFQGCTALKTLSISGFDTSRVASMGTMFSECSSLTSLDLSGFSTAQTSDMESMFYSCSSLETLDLSSFDTSSVENASSMFSFCPSLTTLKIGSGYTLEERPNCFWQSSSGNIYGPNDDLPIGGDTYKRLSADEYLIYAQLSDGILTIAAATEQPSQTDGQLIFPIGCFDSYPSPEAVPWHEYRDSITRVAVGYSTRSINVPVNSMAYWFNDCPNLVSADFQSRMVLQAANLDSLFRNCTQLKTLLLDIDTRHAISMRRMLHGCRALETVTLGPSFTFRGLSDHRLEGGEFPDGVWKPTNSPASSQTVMDDGETIGATANAAYASNSIPSFVYDTYTRVPDSELAGTTVISLYGDGTSAKYTEETTLTADGDIEVSYDLSSYGDGVFAIEELPSASSAIEKNSATIKPTTLAKVKGTNVTRLIVGTKVGKIKDSALAGTNITHLDVESMKLTGSRVKNSLVGSKVRSITIYWTAKGSQATKQKKAKAVRAAFYNTAGNGIWASWGTTASASRKDVKP